MNHTRFPKQNHLPYSARRGNKDKKGDRVDTSAHYKPNKYYADSDIWRCWTSSGSCLIVDFPVNSEGPLGPTSLVSVN